MNIAGLKAYLSQKQSHILILNGMVFDNFVHSSLSGFNCRVPYKYWDSKEDFYCYTLLRYILCYKDDTKDYYKSTEMRPYGRGVFRNFNPRGYYVQEVKYDKYLRTMISKYKKICSSITPTFTIDFINYFISELPTPEVEYDTDYQLLADIYSFVSTKKDRLYYKGNNHKKVHTARNVSLHKFITSIYSKGDIHSSEIRVFKNFEDEYGEDIDALYQAHYGKPCTYRRKYLNKYIHDFNCKILTDFDINEIMKRVKQPQLLDPNISIKDSIKFMRSVNQSHDSAQKKKFASEIESN